MPDANWRFDGVHGPHDVQDMNAQFLLSIVSFERVELEKAPARTQKMEANARELLKTGLWSDGLPAGEDNVVVTVFLTSVVEADDYTFQVDGGQDGAISPFWCPNTQ